MKGHGGSQIMKSRVTRIDSEDSWNSLVTQNCPIVAHFTAAWCMPSVAMNPLFEELAFVYKYINFVSVDVDEVKEAASKMEVKAMPTFLMLKGGARIDKLVGANPEEITRRIHSFFNSIIPSNTN